MCRFHTQTAGCALTAQQPWNNVMRTTLQALAAVLGGTQSLHTNALDEALALPTEHAATLALRTQQVLAYETGVTETVDPFAGSYFVERLTLDLEQAAVNYIRKIDEMGGMIAAIERGYPQREIAQAAYQYQRAVETKEKVVVGVNAFAAERETVEVLSIDASVGERQAEKLHELRSRRDNGLVSRTLSLVEEAARGSANLMPPILDCVRAYATLGEICNRLRTVFGTYQESSVI
jgi:methylmalonyl-CoA mutase N-terminal domain/subunit